MLLLPGYQLRAELHRSNNSIVYQGQREAEPAPVILKVLNKSYPTPIERARFEREYELLRQLHGPGVVEALNLLSHQHSLVLVLEDFGAISLKQWMQAREYNLLERLDIALKIIEALAKVHEQGVTHKDINPTNIVLNPTTGQLKLIDFGLATALAQEESSLHRTKGIEGTLLYLAPEQSGRMNRVVDYRSDFYSLGVTLYELLTGHLPFSFADPLELVHAHIAREPLPPHELNPELPELLSAIILKLMAKGARARYQSAYGLQADLAEVLRQLRATGTVAPFPLGQQDFSPRFRLPQILYGREVELDALLAAFERASVGSSELLLVTGHAGVGKTALINELHKPLVGRRGYFITGKFDQFQRNIPYTAFLHAFRGLVRQLLTESDEQVARWRERLLAALGPNGQLIIEAIPEMELLIGPQPPVPEVGATESQNRFQLLFQNLVEVFAQPEHPLVLFLDDLQWADSASLKLLHLYLANRERHHFLVLGAYRAEAVDERHPLLLLRSELLEAGVTVTTLHLAPLEREHVTQFVADTLQHPVESVAPLAQVIFAKTQGNPFFVGEFLGALHKEGLLTFKPGGWQWELAQIEARNITDNVVTLMQGKLQKLPAATLLSLQRAACIGNEFDLLTLAHVQEQPPAEVADTLWPALESGILVPLGEAYRLVRAASPEIAQELAQTMAVPYRFLHDRVQQATYELIAETERPAVHLRVGRLLLAHSSEAEREERLFELLDHLNQGAALMTDPHEREEVARLNLRAGRKALAATAYEPAAHYLACGIALLPETRWQHCYDLTLSLHLRAAESAYLQGDLARMEALTAEALRHTSDILTRVRIYEVQGLAYHSHLESSRAAERFLAALSLLGTSLPARATTLHIIQSLLRTRWLFGWRAPKTLLEQPAMSDPRALAELRLLMLGGPAIYAMDPNLSTLLTLHGVRLSLRYGNATMSAHTYVSYGVILCAMGDIERGYEVGEVALRMCEDGQAHELEARVLFLFDIAIRYWKKPFRETLPSLLAAYHRALELGDLEYAALAGMIYVQHLLVAGLPLSSVEKEAARYAASIERLGQQSAIVGLQLMRQMVANLRGESADPARLVGDYFDEESQEAVLMQDNDLGTLNIARVRGLMLCYLFGDFARAITLGEKVQKQIDSLLGTIYSALYPFYQSLSLLAAYHQAAPQAQKRSLKQVAANQKKIKKWANHAPSNQAHRYSLVEAERARVRGDHTAAIEQYERAIALAQTHEYPHEAALAQELAGRYYEERGMTHIAAGYLLDARYGYERWGATAKVRWLDEHYPQLLSHAQREQQGPALGDLSLLTTTSSSSSTHGQLLDLATVMKASQAISSEIDLDQLLGKLLHTVMENAGAQQGALLLAREGTLRVEAQGSIDPPQMHLLQGLPIEKSSTLSAAIAHYVERTHEDMVLDDASQQGLFTTDPYIQRTHPRSILSTPLLNQGQLIGVLYLENNLAAGAFTPARVEMVRLLGTQAAISITNAQAIAARAEQERLHMEKLLLERRAQDLAELNASKDKFFSIISHDLRSPFNSLLGLSQLMHKYATTLSQEEVENYSGRVYHSGRQVLTLLDTLLEWSQMQTGRMVFEPREVSLQEIVAQNFSLLADIAENKAIRMISELVEGMVVYADPHMLDTVTRNLLSNALKFTPTGGQVTVAATPDGELIEVSVSDSGVGMSEETMQKLFRIDVTHTTQGTAQEKGTGLGLILCKELVEKNGGQIRVESTLGQGSTFRFTVPRSATMAGHAPGAPSPG